MTDLPDIMSIRELIEAAFGHPDTNTVNHKLIQTILIILAKQLRILERQVGVDITSHYNLPITGTTLSVSEIKLHANVQKKRKGQEDDHVEYVSGQTVTTKTSRVTLDTPRSKTRLRSITEGRTTQDKSDESSTVTDESSAKIISTEKSTERSTDKSADKSKSSSSAKTGTDKSSSSKSKSEKTKSSSKDTSFASRGDLRTLLDNIEVQREKLIRVIKQKSDSREERFKSPTPMASLESMERQYEKLLVVERVPIEEAKRAERSRKSERLSIVTQEEFEELSVAVRHLQKQFKVTDALGFPDNAQLLEDLRKGASLTDAMAALQLSARLEATEKALEKMLSLVTDLAKHTGINMEEAAQSAQVSSMGATKKNKDDSDIDTSVLYDAEEARSAKTHVSSILKKTGQKGSRGSLGISDSQEFGAQRSTGRLVDETESKDCITTDELDEVMQQMYDEFVKMVETATSASTANANNALKIANRLEMKLDASLNLGDRMDNLERAVYDYAEHVNTLDTGLSSQMTNYQELLTQMQHDLESGVETMQEALANTGGDTAAVAELNNHFTNLQMDFDVASIMQKDLRDTLDVLSLDIQALWKQIEVLRDFKSDREEVTDALRDKAGLAALNGLVSRQEFDAVRGDFEKKIAQSYDKFNNQETVWQKAIDDLLRILNEKADWIQVVSLQESIYKYLEKFQSKINAMMDIVGEPRAATIARKLHRDAACLSCATPAFMELEETTKQHLPAFRSLRASAEVEDKPSDDGDHRSVCYPGAVIPHAIDSRVHVCNRYCGGSHTLINNAISRVPPGMIISPAVRQVNTAIGTDGKSYIIDDAAPPKLCKQCNIPRKHSLPKEADPAPTDFPDYKSSDMTPSDFQTYGNNQFGEDPSGMNRSEIMSTTPPPAFDD